MDSNLGLLVLYTFNLFQLRLVQRFVLVIQNNIILVIYRNKLTVLDNNLLASSYD
jgi:hypothetical protein